MYPNLNFSIQYELLHNCRHHLSVVIVTLDSYVLSSRRSRSGDSSLRSGLNSSPEPRRRARSTVVMIIDSMIDADAVLASDSVVDSTLLFFVDSVVGSTEFQVPDSEPDSTAAIVLNSVAGAIAVVAIHSFNGSTTVQVLLRLSARINCRGGLKLSGWLNSRSHHSAVGSIAVVATQRSAQ